MNVRKDDFVILGSLRAKGLKVETGLLKAADVWWLGCRRRHLAEGDVRKDCLSIKEKKFNVNPTGRAGGLGIGA